MKNQMVFRYLVLSAGLLCNGFGVALITKADLGTTPIASLLYTLSLIDPQLTLGNFTFAVSMVLILLQVLVLRKRAKMADVLLQIPISFLFGYIIDFSMKLLGNDAPVHYLAKLTALLAGCVIIAFGACFEVTADMTMLPADGIADAIAKVTGAEFGTVKMITDSTQALIALILGLTVLHRLAGVREGTVIGALLIGNLVKVISHFFRLDHLLEKAGA